MEEDKQKPKDVDIKKELLTPADKFYFMASKNPDIELLVKEFNLQFV